MHVLQFESAERRQLLILKSFVLGVNLVARLLSDLVRDRELLRLQLLQLLVDTRSQVAVFTLNLFDKDQEVLQLRTVASSSEFKNTAEEI